MTPYEKTMVGIIIDKLEERGIVIKYQDSTIPLKVAREKFENNELKDSAAKFVLN